MKPTTEKAFETYIQETLLSRGWTEGAVAAWDKQQALFPEYAIDFIRATQPELWDRMVAMHKEALPAKLTEALIKERNMKGTLHLLRHGFKFYGKTFRLAYFKPAHSLVNQTMEHYRQNKLHVARQIPCHPKESSTVDLVLSMNGLPVATIELKNPSTGQSWRDAVKQYRLDRDHRAPLFLFQKGALVHFAADPDQVHMTTRLNGKSTSFLPFNRGSHPGEIKCGSGNPLHLSGHRTGYFWEEVLERDSFLNIVGSFIFTEKSEKVTVDQNGRRKKIEVETVVFPRYHQLDSVNRLISSARAEGPGSNYLIQHSAGSGKTKSISWLAHRLASLHSAYNAKVFDCVVVITDRRVLDRQLQDAIYQIEHKRGVVQAIDKDARQLSESLIDGTRIVITTLQKFPFILRGLLHIAGAADLDRPDEAAVTRAEEWQKQIAGRNYAVIVDEAHSSQTGETARELKRILGAGTEFGTDENNESDEDWEDGLNRVLESRGRQTNLSFFAFTATPKGKTIEIFGRPGPDGMAVPFHVYSMKQAIEEGFILDVLKHYTTYKVFYGLVKKVTGDPLMPGNKAAKKLGKFLALHPHNIAQKTELIIEHYRDTVRHKLNGRAKAMVVTGSRLHAVRYMKAFQKYIEENHYTDIRPLVAFSGTVCDPETGAEYTEPAMNTDVVNGKPIPESQLPERFDSDDYQVLLVAEKYQTGFDQPLLCAMYVDKKLDGVQAVQTLSRLNRTAPGKEPPFVLDFVNSSEKIEESFSPYYYTTQLEKQSDPAQLEKLKHEMNETGVYLWDEVEKFARIFYRDQAKQSAADHARIEKTIQPAVDRYNQLEEEKREEFYKKMTSFIRLYAFISQILPYSDPELEMLYGYGRLLLSRLFLKSDTDTPDPEKQVELEYYRLEQVQKGGINLEVHEPGTVRSPVNAGGGATKEDEKLPLSEIIDTLNERFGTEFTEEDRLFFEQIRERAATNEKVRNLARANNNAPDKFELGIQELLKEIMIERMSENDDIVAKYMEGGEFYKTVLPLLAKAVFSKVLMDSKAG